MSRILEIIHPGRTLPLRQWCLSNCPSDVIIQHLDDLLDDTIVVSQRVQFSGSCEFSPDLSLSDTICEAITGLLRRKQLTNVLTVGVKYEEHCGTFFKPRSHADFSCLNSSFLLLLSKAWSSFFKQVGHELFIRLITDTSIFISVGRGSYLQLTGPTNPGRGKVSKMSEHTSANININTRQSKDSNEYSQSWKELHFAPFGLKSLLNKIHPNHQTKWCYGFKLSKMEFDVFVKTIFPKYHKHLIRKKSISSFQELHQRVSKVSVGGLFQAKCPSVAISGPSTTTDLGILPNCTVNVHQVQSFLVAAIKKIFGPVLLPKVVIKSLRKFLMKLLQMNCYDKVLLGNFITTIKLSELSWLKAVKDPVLRRVLMARFVQWIVCEVVPSIIKQYFYLTTSKEQKKKVLYFRKDVWCSLSQKAFEGLKQRGMYIEGASQSQTSRKPNHKIRFLPKPVELRPISICLDSRMKTRLRRILPVLASMKNDSDLGKAHTIHDLPTLWKDFRRTFLGRRVYVVKTDVRHCFDSMLHKKLCGIVKSLILKAAIYYVFSYIVVTKCGSKIHRKFHKGALSVKQSRSNYFDGFASQLNRSNVIYINLYGGKRIRNEDICKEVLSLLDTITVKPYGSSHLLHQCQGIPQGSSLAQVLCDLYLSDMESSHLASFIKGPSDGDLLFRKTDDYLLLTINPDTAQKFLKVMVEGIPAYNCFVSMSKTGVNFPPSGFPEVQQMCEDAVLQWCGHIFHLQSLSIGLVRPSFKELSLSLTVDETAKSRDLATSKLISDLQRKAQMIYFDVQTVIFPKMVDTPETLIEGRYSNGQVSKIPVILKNLWNLFVSLAQKFRIFIKKLFKQSSFTKHAQYWLDFISCVLPKLFLNKMSEKLKDRSLSPCFSLSLVKYVCVKAFHVELKKSHLATCEEIMMEISQRLKNIHASLGSKTKLLSHISGRSAMKT